VPTIFSITSDAGTSFNACFVSYPSALLSLNVSSHRFCGKGHHRLAAGSIVIFDLNSNAVSVRGPRNDADGIIYDQNTRFLIKRVQKAVQNQNAALCLLKKSRHKSGQPHSE
jgi:hypothetical protein